MAKVYAYTVFLVGLMILLEMAGISTGISNILQLVGITINGFGTDNVSLTSSTLWEILFNAQTGALILGIGGGIVASLLTKSSPENYIILPLITGIGTAFISTFFMVINYSFEGGNAFVAYIILLIMAPLAVGYIISLAEFFRGTD